MEQLTERLNGDQRRFSGKRLEQAQCRIAPDDIVEPLRVREHIRVEREVHLPCL
jgi:hypothetical protein